MKAVNLFFLTRTHDAAGISLLLKALAARPESKTVSAHEAATLCSLTDDLCDCLSRISPDCGTESESGWLRLLDGFYFSYTIAHIGKEFDLLKVSADGSCILNIELKSEDVGEEKIRRQLEQNRYYLTHISRTILSYTYVMETQTLYVMNDRNYLRACSMRHLADALARPALRICMTDGIDELFRASDYLISPIAAPEKFLQKEYFLTNQQADFRRRILEHLKETEAPVVSLTGSAGTGKTLLLLDLAMLLSGKHQVLFVHAGPLREGHLVLDRRLRKVTICSGEEPLPGAMVKTYSYLLIDEATHLKPSVLDMLLGSAAAGKTPVILAYDPHQLFCEEGLTDYVTYTEERVAASATLCLTFSGNIRINRPMYSFLRRLFHRKETAGQQDYDCIDVLYAADTEEAELTADYYRRLGYVQIGTPGSLFREGELIAQEYDKVLLTINDTFYYNESGFLCTRPDSSEALRLLYEGFLRTRDRLCLLVTGSRQLFLQVLDIKLNRVMMKNERPDEDGQRTVSVTHLLT